MKHVCEHCLLCFSRNTGDEVLNQMATTQGLVITLCPYAIYVAQIFRFQTFMVKCTENEAKQMYLNFKNCPGVLYNN